jgi:hypothetical protein
MFPGPLEDPPFGNPAIRPLPDPWLCVPASRRVCLYREGALRVAFYEGTSAIG